MLSLNSESVQLVAFAALAIFFAVRALLRRFRPPVGVVDSFTISLGDVPGELVCEIQTDDRRRFAFTWDARLAHTFSDQLLTAAARSVPPKTF